MTSSREEEENLGDDRYPGAPRILFVGLAESTHARGWIELLDDFEMNARLFALPSGVPPPSWHVPTYLSIPYALQPLPPGRWQAAAIRSPRRRWHRLATRVGLRDPHPTSVEEWLANAIASWRPDVIHSFGIEGASELVLRVCAREGVPRPRAWVVQARGGPDLALHRLLPDRVEGIRAVLAACDEFIADNALNYEYAVELGLCAARCSPLGVVPGSGGVDVDALAARGALPPSKRARLVLWPKAYECPQSKALPVLEALRMAWSELAPCQVVMLAAMPEVRMWLRTLPPEIQAACTIEDRIPRECVLDLMTKARIMLAPSLSDGVPNSLYESMASGAFPIVSPIETLESLVEDGRHVLFAHNLHPGEIARALVRAMDDDVLVDAGAQENREWVRWRANRNALGPRVADRYRALAARPGAAN